MGKGAVLSLKITGDASSAKAALDDAEGKAGSFGSSLGKIAGIAAGAFAVDKVLDFGKASFDAASNLEQMQGSVDAVFGSIGDARVEMTKFGLDSAKSVGLSTAAYDQMAAIIGSQLKNAGTPVDQLATKTNNLIKQGADMSAVFGGSAADAVDALSSALRGEMDPIERYGVSLNQAAIDGQATADGAHKVNGAWTQQAKTAAILELVTKQTAQTQGQFAAQSGTAAEKAQSLSAWFENLQAKVGNYLLPVFVALGTLFQDKIAPLIGRLVSGAGPLGAIFAQVGDFLTQRVIPALSSLWNELAPKLLPILRDVGAFVSGFVVPAFQMLGDYIARFVVPTFKNYLSPIISAIGTVFHNVTQKIMEHKDTFVGLYNSLQPFLSFIRDKVAPIVGGIFAEGFKIAGAAIGFVVDVIAKIVDSIKWLLDKGAAIGKFIGKLFGAGGSSSSGTGGAHRGAGLLGASAGARPLFGAAGTLGSGGAGPSVAAAGLAVPVGDTYVITVQGALDPTAVADQIAALLDRRARRIGLSPAVAR